MSDSIWERVEKRMNDSLRKLEERLGDDGNGRSGRERRYGKGFSVNGVGNGERPGSVGEEGVSFNDDRDSNAWSELGYRLPEIPRFNKFKPRGRCEIDLYYENEGWIDVDVVDVE